MSEMKTITLNGKKYEIPEGATVDLNTLANLHVWRVGESSYICAESADAYSGDGYEYLGRLGDAFESGSALPPYTEEDAGKVLTITAEGLAWAEAGAALPDADEAFF